MPSSIRPTRDGALRSRLAPEELTIDDWPLRDRPLSSAVALGLAGGAIWLVVWTTGNRLAGAVIVVLLTLTLWRTCLPVRYQLGAGGVVQSTLGWRRRISWSSIRHYELHAAGALISPDSTSTSLSSLRGLFLPWGGQREALIAQLEHYLGNPNDAVGGSTRSLRIARPPPDAGQ